MKTTASKARARKTGRYTYSAEHVCECGRRLGEHDAEAPHALYEDGADCDGFKPAKKK